MRVLKILPVQRFLVVLGLLPTISMNPSQKAFGLDERYHTYQEVIVELDSLHNAFPEITRLDSIGHTTRDSLAIWCLKISDNPSLEEDEPGILLLGNQHPEELLGGRS
ncbi:MAG: M14 family zinc carboxypeptidase [Candidatus Zixiibacteriota bacterium]